MGFWDSLPGPQSYDLDLEVWWLSIVRDTPACYG